MTLTGRSLGPDGTHKYWKEGDKANTGGTKGVDYILKNGVWKKASIKPAPHEQKVNV